MAGAAFIDLNAMSVTLSRRRSVRRSRPRFMSMACIPTPTAATSSRCIVEGIRQAGLGLAQQLADDPGPFDVTHPLPPPDDFQIPARVSPVAAGPPRASGHGRAYLSANQIVATVVRWLASGARRRCNQSSNT